MPNDDRKNHPLLEPLEQWYAANRVPRVPLYPPEPQSEKLKLPPHVEAKLSKLIREGRKIEAMKEALDLTGAGLRLAKEYVDELEKKALLWSNDKLNPKK